MANAANLGIFFAGTAIVCYVINGQLCGPLEGRIKGAQNSIAANQDFITAGNGLRGKTNALKNDNEKAGPVLTEVQKMFPAADIDTSKLTSTLDAATHDLAGVNIIKAPPMRKDNLGWCARTVVQEEFVGTYKRLVGDSTKPVSPEKLTAGLHITRLDQDWELECDWESFPALLNKISKLEYYFEPTKVDVTGFVDPTFKKDYRPPKTGPKSTPKKVHANVVCTTVAFPPLPSASPKP